MKRKYSETQEERYARMAREKALGISTKRRIGGGYGTGEAAVDPNVVMRMLEERKQSIDTQIKPVDLEIVIKHDAEQCRMVGGTMVKRIRMVTNRNITMIHLAILICYKNGLKEDEWPNFDFYPCIQNNTIKEEKMKKLFLNGQPKAFKFRSSAREVLMSFSPGDEDTIKKLELIYKKKPMPQITTNKMNSIQPPTVFNPFT